MKKISLFNLCMMAAVALTAQTYKPGIKLQKGQQFEIIVSVKGTMSQAGMDMPIESSMKSAVVVFNEKAGDFDVVSENKHFTFKTSMMGNEASYDSEKKDNDDQMSDLFKDIVKKADSFVVTSAGITKLSSPEKPATKKDEKKSGMMGMMLGGVVASNGGSPLFNVLPVLKELKIGESVADSVENNSKGREKTVTVYTITDIKDGKVKVAINGTTNLEKDMEVEQMGMSMTIKLSSVNTSKGEMLIDEATGLLAGKTITTETNGTAAVMGQEIPITGTSTATITVKKL